MVLNPDWPILLFCGVAGAFVKDTLKDNKIQMPHFKEGYLYLGCIGGMILGGMAGYAVDNDPMTAFLGGYAGSQVIQSLVTPKKDSPKADGIK